MNLDAVALSKALWMVGVPNLGGWIPMHPLLLNAQLFAREIGIQHSPFLTNSIHRRK
jgi:hypothetical protein